MYYYRLYSYIDVNVLFHAPAVLIPERIATVTSDTLIKNSYLLRHTALPALLYRLIIISLLWRFFFISS